MFWLVFVLLLFVFNIIFRCFWFVFSVSFFTIFSTFCSVCIFLRSSFSVMFPRVP